MEHTNVFVKILIVVVSDDVGLMAQSDSSEELSDHCLVCAIWSFQNQIGCLVMVLHIELHFIRQIVQLFTLIKGVVICKLQIVT